jgi:hypothetical protein
MDLLLLPFLWTKREGENGILLGKGEEASCCGGSAVCAAVQWIAKGPVLQVMFRLVSAYFSLFSLTEHY